MNVLIPLTNGNKCFFDRLTGECEELVPISRSNLPHGQIMRRLFLVVPTIVSRHPEGIIDDDLLRELEQRGISCFKGTLTEVCKRLEAAGLLKIEEWKESYWSGDYLSRKNRRKYFTKENEG
ncbi:MAG: hypothetical protein OEY22_08460 [Candidatus Bathyarchaeota archaeon]|nr:hypothetical protein [Candidatus Bathyarchaeota archaeon]MDH5787882.1 hypothetical protein [Candidatus Bathyarchaeota archaeon]